MKKVKKVVRDLTGSVLEVEIEKLLPGGLGLAHSEGITLMVSLSVPGDRLKVKVYKQQNDIAFASPVEILSKGAGRTEPLCTYFGQCGGCNLQQLTYSAQLEAKLEIVKDCLKRIGQMEPPDSLEIVPSPNPFQYRSRARFRYNREKRAIGFYAPQSNNLVDISVCPVLKPELQEKFLEIRRNLPSFEKETGEIQAIAGNCGVTLHPSDTESSEQVITVCGNNYHVNADSFFQTNLELLPQMLQEAVQDLSGNSAIDLYSGVGLFTLPLAKKFKKVYAVESNRSAVDYSKINLKEAGLGNVDVFCEMTGNWLAKQTKMDELDLLLLDPPRVGADNLTIKGITDLNPKRIVYVSCDPATLSRDLRKLRNVGYEIVRMRAFDMFPQTHHIETVTHLIAQQI
jgi:23S rRNA (uracil1939-C5)-methyltransferase